VLRSIKCHHAHYGWREQTGESPCAGTKFNDIGVLESADIIDGLRQILRIVLTRHELVVFLSVL
jgi:hypothetical protein